jgi:uncharacterized protein involved in outer membrane biogenesis
MEAALTFFIIVISVAILLGLIVFGFIFYQFLKRKNQFENYLENKSKDATKSAYNFFKQKMKE